MFKGEKSLFFNQSYEKKNECTVKIYVIFLFNINCKDISRTIQAYRRINQNTW